MICCLCDDDGDDDEESDKRTDGRRSQYNDPRPAVSCHDERRVKRHEIILLKPSAFSRSSSSSSCRGTTITARTYGSPKWPFLFCALRQTTSLERTMGGRRCQDRRGGIVTRRSTRDVVDVACCAAGTGLIPARDRASVGCGPRSSCQTSGRGSAIRAWLLGSEAKTSNASGPDLSYRSP
jgi:hypothetical protein